MNVTFKVREAFFDRPKVIASMKKAKRKVLSKAGAFVRKRARSSMRRRKSASAPGSPPSAHSSGNSLKTILFAYQPQSESTIVGPVQFADSSPTIVRTTSTSPGLQERGESAVIREYRYQPIQSNAAPSQWLPVRSKRIFKQRPGYTLQHRTRTVRFQKRPFMGPALEAEAPKFPELFKNSIAAAR
jgi:hypothetical protein